MTDKDTFPHKECETCEYFCDDKTDLLGFTYQCCGRNPFKLDEQKCPHRENKENENE